MPCMLGTGRCRSSVYHHAYRLMLCKAADTFTMCTCMSVPCNVTHLQDHILGAGPLGQLASQLDTNDLGALELPGQASHHVHSISTTHTDSSHTQATSIGGVGVSADHQEAGDGVVLQDCACNARDQSA